MDRRGGGEFTCMARPMSQSVVPKLSIAHVSLPYPDALTMTPYAGRMSWRWISRVAVSGWGLRLLPVYLHNMRVTCKKTCAATDINT